MQAGEIHSSIKSISWLIGKWRSVTAKGYYPTIKTFEYCDEIEFTSIGLPMLNFSGTSWNPENKKPMHLEKGFLRIKSGTTDIAFISAHNFGITSLEEGCVRGTEIVLKSKNISRVSFSKAPAVTATERVIKLIDNCLHITFSMATENTPLTEHLKATYEKI